LWDKTLSEITQKGLRFSFNSYDQASRIIWDNSLLEKNAPDMIRAATVRAAMQNAQTLNVVRLKASQMLSTSESEVTMV
jgi:hypothetical protein